MTTYTYDQAKQLLDDGHGITREAWGGKHYIYAKNGKYFSVLVSIDGGTQNLQQSVIGDLTPYLEEDKNDYQIYPPAPAYGFEEGNA